MLQITSPGMRRDKPFATSGEMCSSSRSFSMSASGWLSGNEFDGLWQHALDRGETGSLIFRQRLIYLAGKCLRVVECCLNLSRRPMQVPCHGFQVVLIAKAEEDDFPNGKAAALDICLPAHGRITKIDECEFRAAQTFLDQPCACVAGSPSMTIRHPPQPLPAGFRQTHTDDCGLGRLHCRDLQV